MSCDEGKLVYTLRGLLPQYDGEPSLCIAHRNFYYQIIKQKAGQLSCEALKDPMRLPSEGI